MAGSACAGLSARVEVSGKDELTALGASLNVMLAELQKTAQTHQALTNAIPDLILRVGESGRLLDANRPGDPLLKGALGPGQPAQPRSCRRTLPSAACRSCGQPWPQAGCASSSTASSPQGAPGLRGAHPAHRRRGGAGDHPRRDRRKRPKKEMLLREIHHRVKNNLQVVSSLLYLQGQQVGDPRLAAILEENRHRIRSIALIHEKLYQSADPGEVRFAAYLRDLANNLLIAYGATPPLCAWRSRSRRRRCWAWTRRSSWACSISELVSNSLKHAFPVGGPGASASPWNARPGRAAPGGGGRRGGAAPGCDPATSRSMGLLLVQLFSRQLGAPLEVQPKGAPASSSSSRTARRRPLDRRPRRTVGLAELAGPQASSFRGRGSKPAISPITLTSSVSAGTTILAFAAIAFSTVSRRRISWALPTK